VDGEREYQILHATMEVLNRVGYDLLTMDAVAARAKASKATLYRRWRGKAELVLAAITSHMATAGVPDTGTLRGDLLEICCGADGLNHSPSQTVFAAVISSLGRDAELAEVYRRDIVGPVVAAYRTVCERARERGEVHPDADLSILAPALAGIVLHQTLVLGDETADLVGRILDEVVLPAAQHGPCRRDTADDHATA
jgi:AcrR family transcriptional regulator